MDKNIDKNPKQDNEAYIICQKAQEELKGCPVCFCQNEKTALICKNCSAYLINN